MRLVRELGTVLAVGACIAALALLGGCGGDGGGDRMSRDAYLQEFRAMAEEFVAKVDELENADADVTDGQAAVARLAGELAAGFEEIGQKLAALSPPEDVQDPHDDLVAGVEAVGVWLRRFADRARAASAADLTALVEELGDPTKVDGVQRIRDARRAFRAAGYEFSASAEGYDTDGPGQPDAGKTVFASAGCGSCHALADAGATGFVGPDLDTAFPPYGLVVERVTNGMGAMPAFAGQLTEQEIDDVAAYVSSAATG